MYPGVGVSGRHSENTGSCCHGLLHVTLVWEILKDWTELVPDDKYSHCDGVLCLQSGSTKVPGNHCHLLT